MPPLLAASAAVRLAVDGRSGRSAGAAGALFSHTRGHYKTFVMCINCFFQITLEITHRFVLFNLMLCRASHLLTNCLSVFFTGTRYRFIFGVLYGGHTVYMRGYMTSLLPQHVVKFGVKK